MKQSYLRYCCQICAVALGSTLQFYIAQAAEDPISADLIPAEYRSVIEFTDIGTFLSRNGRNSLRRHDGNHYHGYDGPLVWNQESGEVDSQGLIYSVIENSIVSAGYLIRQDDLEAGRSFHGLTLRELELPPAYSMTVEFIEATENHPNSYLFLWHFIQSVSSSASMLPYGELPDASALPDAFQVFACDHVPETRFCPGMGRHFIDLSDATVSPSFTRQPDSQGDRGVIYGEAAEKLIFIEYVFAQQDFIAGKNWSIEIPLDGLPIPPIDNVHVLHFGTDDSTNGRYTVHMYFLPEEIYLPWEEEPESL